MIDFFIKSKANRLFTFNSKTHWLYRPGVQRVELFSITSNVVAVILLPDVISDLLDLAYFLPYRARARCHKHTRTYAPRRYCETFVT